MKFFYSELRQSGSRPGAFWESREHKMWTLPDSGDRGWRWTGRPDGSAQCATFSWSNDQNLLRLRCSRVRQTHTKHTRSHVYRLTHLSGRHHSNTSSCTAVQSQCRLQGSLQYRRLSEYDVNDAVWTGWSAEVSFSKPPLDRILSPAM